MNNYSSVQPSQIQRSTLGTRILWFLIYFVLTEGFGLRSETWGGLGKDSLGWFGLMQVVVAALSIISVPQALDYLLKNRRLGVGAAVLWVGLLPFYMIVISLFRFALGHNVGLDAITSGLIQSKFFMMMYLFIYLVSRENGFQDALNAMTTCALIAAISTVIIITLQLDTAVTRMSNSTDVTRLFRAIIPGALLIEAGWLMFLSKYLVFGGRANLLGSFICLGATVVQFHRSTLLAVSIVVVLLLYQIFISGRLVAFQRKWKMVALFGIVVVGGAAYALVSFSVAFDYVATSFGEASEVSGNSGHRALLVLNSLYYVFADTFGLGLGFDWDRVDDLGAYLAAAFVAGPTFDSSYANTIIVWGLPGVALFSWLFYGLASMASKQRMVHAHPLERMFAFFIRLFSIFCLVIGIGTDIVLLTPGAAILVLCFVLAVQLQVVRRQAVRYQRRFSA